VARPAGNIGAAIENATAGRAQHSRDRADQRRLACSIGADDGYDGALLDLERYAVERLRVAVKDIDIVYGEHQTVSAPR
jgi:hypothetical protein